MNLAHFLPMLALFVIPSVACIISYFQIKKKNEKPSIKLSTVTAFNSAVLFALSYNIIFFIQELFLVLGKNYIGLDAYLYHNNHNWEGSHPKEALMQGSGAAAIFILGLLLLLAQTFVSNKSWVKIFLIWLTFNGLAQSLPQFATAQSDSGTDTGQAIYYLGFSEPVLLMITIGSWLAMAATLIFFATWIQKFSPDNSTKRSRFNYAKHIILWGMLIGVALIIPFRIPPTDRIMAVVFLAMLCIPLMITFAWRRNTITIDNEINHRFLWLPLILLVVLLGFFQFYLAKGVLFTP